MKMYKIETLGNKTVLVLSNMNVFSVISKYFKENFSYPGLTYEITFSYDKEFADWVSIKESKNKYVTMEFEVGLIYTTSGTSQSLLFNPGHGDWILKKREYKPIDLLIEEKK